MCRTSLSAVTAFVLSCIASAHAQEWGCYDPKPGHPTAAEKQAFIEDVSAQAVLAEKKHGVPAAALAAMAMVESGYGWTRTAQDARNFFGWKFNSTAAAGGRQAYVLGCQPPEDVNNRYVVFASAADAVDFVAGKLATLPAYKAKTVAYGKARSTGTSAEAASRAWIAAIANPYNWRPAEYTKTVTRFMNDPASPSEQVSPDRNLYRLSAAIAPATPQPAASATAPDTHAATRAYFASKLAKRTCEAPRDDYPQWKGLPVQRCDYSDSGVTAKTYMLNPSADRLARWTVTACADAGATAPAACAKAVSSAIISTSSGVFPVAGFIPEPAESGGGQGTQVLCFLFRDGVTVNTAKIGAPAATNGQCASGDENEQPVVRARRFARVASTTRLDYKQSGGSEPVGTDADGDPRWLDVVRTLYQRAWTSDRNELISARAKAMRAAGEFK
jgi:hypothetical protein